MKKLISLLLTIVIMLSSVSMTVSAASVDEIVSLTKLGFNFMEEIFEHFSDVIDILEEVAEIVSNIDIPEKEDPPKDDIQEETPEIIVPPVTPSVEVRAGVFGYESTYVVYGEVVPCNWIHTNDSATMVEILSDVQSEEFLDMGQVAELFYEEFGHSVRISKRGTYLKCFFIEDRTDISKKFLIPVKEEGLPVEVWEKFVIEFEEEFEYDYFYTLLGVQMYFEELLGYQPEVKFSDWGKDYGTISITFRHLGGETYLLEAFFVQEFNKCCVPDGVLVSFLNKYPECADIDYCNNGQ